MSTAVLVIAIVIALGSYLMWLAGRLDRLQVRVESARASLDAQLVRRAAAARELAASTPDAPWAAELRDTAAAVLAGAVEQEAVESALTRAIRSAVGGTPGTAGAHDAIGGEATLIAAATKVRFARQFHNDTVHALLALRRRRRVRWLRLWGTAKAPTYFEIDDTLG